MSDLKKNWTLAGLGLSFKNSSLDLDCSSLCCSCSLHSRMTESSKQIGETHFSITAHAKVKPELYNS